MKRLLAVTVGLAAAVAAAVAYAKKTMEARLAELKDEQTEEYKQFENEIEKSQEEENVNPEDAEEIVVTLPIESKIKIEESEDETNESEQNDDIPQDELQTYIINKNMNKFHKPDCTGLANVSEKNKIEVETTRNALIARGCKPCQRCGS